MAYDATDATVSIVFVMGGPGSGKTTQCRRLSQDRLMEHICLADLICAEVASGSSRGRHLRLAIERDRVIGECTAMSVIRDAVMNRMTMSGRHCLLIDGLPLSLEQAIAFETQILPCHGVIYYRLEESQMRRRLAGAAQIGARGGRRRNYFENFLRNISPLNDAKGAGGEGGIDERINDFNRFTMPAVKHYTARKMLIEVTMITGDADD